MCSKNGSGVPVLPNDDENVVPLERGEDLNSKYGQAGGADVAGATKKRTKKPRGRPIDLEFGPHNNGLSRSSERSQDPLYMSHDPTIMFSHHQFDIQVNEIMPTMLRVFREYIHNIGHNISDLGQLGEFLDMVEFLEVSESDAKTMQELKKSGKLFRLVALSDMFDIKYEDGFVTFAAKTDDGVSVFERIRQRNLANNRTSLAKQPAVGSGYGSGLNEMQAALGAMDTNGTTTIPFQNTASSSVYTPQAFSSDTPQAKGILNGHTSTNNQQQRPSSADASRGLMTSGIWSVPSLASNQLCDSLSNNVTTDRLRHELNEREEELSQMTERSVAMVSQIKTLCKEKDELEARVRELESNARQRECFSRESEHSRPPTERERQLERENAGISVESSTYKALWVAQRNKLKKAYRELLDLRLGKAKMLAKRRIEQAKSGAAHAEMLRQRLPLSLVELIRGVHQVSRQWRQIGADYEEWLLNLDRLADAQMVLIDEEKNFDDLPLLTPPNHIPGAPSLSPALRAWFEMTGKASSKCSTNGSITDVGLEFQKPRAAPPGLETASGIRTNKFGAIGQRRKVTTTHSSNSFSDTNQNQTKQISGPKQQVAVANDTATASVAPWALSHNDTRRNINMDNYDCKICLSSIMSTAQLMRCPSRSCNEPFHKECVLEWVKKEQTCPNCKGVFRDPREYPSLLSASH